MFDEDSIERYPLVNPNEAVFLAVHVAYDATPEEHVCWWNENVLRSMEYLNVKQYNVGMVYGCNNYQIDLQTRDNNIAHVQLYTRLFHQLHRDDNR